MTFKGFLIHTYPTKVGLHISSIICPNGTVLTGHAKCMGFLRKYSTNLPTSDSAPNNVKDSPFLNSYVAKTEDFILAGAVDVQVFIRQHLNVNRAELLAQYGLLMDSNFGKNLSLAEPALEGFIKLYHSRGNPGIYWIVSKTNPEISYIGSTADLYARLNGHKLTSASNPRKHPKLYSYINKYGWSAMEIRVLANIPDYLILFRELNPDAVLSDTDTKALKMLTRYGLLTAEQFCIDQIKPGKFKSSIFSRCWRAK